MSGKRHSEQDSSSANKRAKSDEGEEKFSDNQDDEKHEEESDYEKRRRKEREDRAALRKHGLAYYSYLATKNGTIYSYAKPGCLSGTYDIVFRYYEYCDSDGNSLQCRTTKGIATLSEDEQGNITGRLDFLPELSWSRPLVFKTSNPSSEEEGIGYGNGMPWERAVVAKLGAGESADSLLLDDYQPLPAGQPRHQKSALLCIRERCVMGRVQRENDGAFGRVPFRTLREAEETLANSQRVRLQVVSKVVGEHVGSEGTEIVEKIAAFAAGPPPVFFLEPGDLMLSVYWKGIRNNRIINTKCTLRKRASHVGVAST